MSKLNLDLLPLETRVNPAGAFTTSMMGTALILTGTDEAESIIIRDDGVGMTIEGQNGTLIDGLAAKSFATAVNSLRILAKGGDDTISLDQTLPLSLSGRLHIDLGNSAINNTLNLVTPLAISLGSMRINSATGPDTALIGGLSATVTGDIIANFGNGSSELFLQSGTIVQGNLTIQGGLGFSRLDLNTVTVDKNLRFNPGDGTSELNIVASTINGNVSVSAGRGDDTLTLDNVTIGGTNGLSVIGRSGKANLVTTNLDVNLTKGGVSVNSADNDASLLVGAFFKSIGPTTINGRTATANANAEFQTKALTMSGAFGSSFNANGSSINIGGAVNIQSTNGIAEYLQPSGSLSSQGQIRVSGMAANFSPNGGTFVVGGDVNVFASSRTATFDRSASSQYTFDGNITVRGAGANVNFSSGFGSVAKNVSVTALADNLNFNVNGTVSFAKNLTIRGRNSPANITLISNTSDIQGNLTINTGEDADTVTISGLRVSGTTVIKTAGGGDTVALDNGARFIGPTLIDTGAGDDFLQFARASGLFTTAVEFTSKATILAGTGNDQLQLGRSVADSGDGNSRASFAAGSIIQGGLNLNSFDDETGQTLGLPDSPQILNWSDPTP